LTFDKHSAGYSQKVSDALGVVGLEHGFFFEAKVREILEARRRLATEGAVRVLDLGCGIGLLIRRLRPLLASVWGIDPSIASLVEAEAPEGRLIAADGLRTPFADESFDLVIAVCVLHHVPVDNRAAFLAEAARITRRGGLVLLSEHNPWNPLTRVVVGRCELDDNAVLLSQSEARRLLAGAGLTNIRARYIHFFPWSGVVWSWLEARLARLPLGGAYMIEAVRA
jgi:SAM-dependent methyltransferase